LVLHAAKCVDFVDGGSVTMEALTCARVHEHLGKLKLDGWSTAPTSSRWAGATGRKQRPMAEVDEST
jgi:hypothetical protein